jgi:hypothetical protein
LAIQFGNSVRQFSSAIRCAWQFGLAIHFAWLFNSVWQCSFCMAIRFGNSFWKAIRFDRLFNSVWQIQFDNSAIRFGNSVWQNKFNFDNSAIQFGNTVRQNEFNLTIRQFASAIRFGICVWILYVRSACMFGLNNCLHITTVIYMYYE